MRERIGSLVLRAYPRVVRRARGPEMLSMLLDAGEHSRLTFARECASLVIGGLRERAHSHGPRKPVATGTIIAVLALGAIVFATRTLGRAQDDGNMQSLATRVMTRLRPGDLVFVTDPSQTSLAYRFLPDGLRYATPLGLDDHPGVAYQHPYSRPRGSYPRTYLKRLLTTLVPGQHVLLIRSLDVSEGTWSSPQTRIARRRAAQLGAILAQDPKLRVVTWAPHAYAGRCCVTDSAVLYVQS